MNTPNSKSSPGPKSVFPRCYHLKQKLAITLGLAAAALLLPSIVSAQCVTANPGIIWQNTAMTAQTGTFTATFDATPSASPTNSVVALSDGEQTAYANFSCLARFNPTGDIDARNGGAFAAAATIPYKAGVAYHFRLVVNVAAKTYSIYVTPAGGSELTVGLNYAFRIAATTLNWWGVSIETAGTGGVGTVTVCNFSTGGTVTQAGTPSFSPAPGTYTSAQSVAITTATTGASIRYTTDGSTPSETAGTLYSGPVNISATATLQAIAYESGFTDSTIASGTYTITSSPPPAGIAINSGGPAVSPFVADEDFTGGATIDHANAINTTKVTNPAPAAVYQSARVTATAGAGTTFSYTIGGFTAGSSNTVRLHFCETFWTAAGSRVFNVSINGTPVLTNFDIFATAGGQNIANIQEFAEPANSSGQYVILFTTDVDKALISGIEIGSSTTTPTAAAPSFSPGGGTYTSAQNVTITSATSGASIRYTLDGSTPSATAGTLYSGPVNISSTATLKAVAYESGFTTSAVTSATYTIGSGGGPGPLPEHLITGYYQDFDNGAAVLRLTSVPMTYNLIAVAFATATGTPGQVTFSVDSGLSSALGGYSQAQFIADIATCKARGQHVILSVGGADGTISVNSSASATAFANSVNSIMATWGFQGVDIDLENGISPTFMAQALRQLTPGSIITMAPQTVDVASASSDYLALALSIKDILTICNCQYYNSGSQFGADGKIYNEGTEDFLTALAVIQLQAGLAPSQVGLGLPASPSGAGSGYVSPSVVVRALQCLATGANPGTYIPPAKYPTIRGAMTWSINWDASNGYNFANTVSAGFGSL